MPSHDFAVFVGLFFSFFFFLFFPLSIYLKLHTHFQGKSALWSHLLQYQEKEEKQEHGAESPGEYLAVDSIKGPLQQMSLGLGGTLQTM